MELDFWSTNLRYGYFFTEQHLQLYNFTFNNAPLISVSEISMSELSDDEYMAIIDDEWNNTI